MRKFIKINGKISKLQNTIGKGGDLIKKRNVQNKYTSLKKNIKKYS